MGRLHLGTLRLTGLCLSIILGLISSSLPARTVRVCVLNDDVAPVEESIILSLTLYVSDEYEKHVGIRFDPTEFHSIDLEFPQSEQARFDRIRQRCRKSEIALIFTSQMIRSTDWETSANEPAHPTPDESPYLLGLASPRGYAMLTSVPYGLSSLDAKGIPRIYGTIKHEIGHLFTEGHLEDSRSFLYRYGNGLNDWTSETEWAIRRRCLRKWELEPRVLHLTREDLID